ncbi:MAG: hypothetical protein AAB482_00990 [Patescibacteria group bacterium]
MAGGIIFLVSAKNAPKPTKLSKISVLNQKEPATDIDRDGIEDWQEVLAGTDPKDPNSKPTKDQLTNISPDTSLPLEQNVQNNSAPTKAILENFSQFYKNQAANTSDVTYDLTDPATQKLFIKPGVDEAKKVLGLRNPFKEQDIVISDTATLRDYFNEVARVTQKNFPSKPGDPNYTNEILTIYALATNLQESSEQISKEEFTKQLQTLAPYRSQYLHATNDLKKISTPRAAIQTQIDFLNSFANTSLALEEIMNFDHDPILGSVGMQMYLNEFITSNNTFIKIKKILRDNAIVFNKDEPAFEFQTDYLAKTN